MKIVTNNDFDCYDVAEMSGIKRGITIDGKTLEEIIADEKAKVLKDLYASDKSGTLKELLNIARAEGAREFAKWLEDTYWIELSVSNDVCCNYDCDEIIKEYEKVRKE